MKSESVFFVLILALLIFSVISGIQKPRLNMKLEGKGSLTAQEIFMNNLMIDAVIVVPVVGWLFAVYQAWLVGNILANYANQAGISPFVMLVTVLSWPHFYLELTAYALMATASFCILKGDLKKAVSFALASIVMLYFAAWVEDSI